MIFGIILWLCEVLIAIELPYRVAPAASLPEPNARKIQKYVNTFLSLTALWPLRLVVQDVWFSSRKSRVRLPQGSPSKKLTERWAFYLLLDSCAIERKLP